MYWPGCSVSSVHMASLLQASPPSNFIFSWPAYLIQFLLYFLLRFVCLFKHLSLFTNCLVVSLLEYKSRAHLSSVLFTVVPSSWHCACVPYKHLWTEWGMWNRNQNSFTQSDKLVMRDRNSGWQNLTFVSGNNLYTSGVLAISPAQFTVKQCHADKRFNKCYIL